MQDFSHRGKYVEFWQVTGEVLASDKYHETHISGRGGGGYIGQYSGRIKPIAIDSSTVINHEFWIKTKYGVERDIKLHNINIPLRSGQKITLISAARKGADTGLYSILVNHSAGKHWFINSAQDLNKKLQLEQLTGKSLLIAGGIACGLSFLINENPEIVHDSILYIKNLTGIFDGIHWEDIAKTIILGIPSAFVIYRLILKLRRVSELTNKLDNHLEKLAQFAYINY